MIMNYYDYWEYDIIDFLSCFIGSELDYLNVKEFLKRFELDRYEISIDLKEAKRILLVYGDSEYIFSSTDLSWISDRTKALVCTFENRNLIFVDLDSSRDTYYISSAAFIKVFNKAFPNNNCFVFKTCDGLAVGSMRCFNVSVVNNFCVTQLFQESTLHTAIEFFEEILFDNYEEIPAIIINYSPQERYDYVQRHNAVSEWDGLFGQPTCDFIDEPIIYTTYREACGVLHHVASDDSVSSFDVLEAAIVSEQKAMAVPMSLDDGNHDSLRFEEESKYSAEAYANAEQMLKEMLSTK